MTSPPSSRPPIRNRYGRRLQKRVEGGNASSHAVVDPPDIAHLAGGGYATLQKEARQGRLCIKGLRMLRRSIRMLWR